MGLINKRCSAYHNVQDVYNIIKNKYEKFKCVEDTQELFRIKYICERNLELSAFASVLDIVTVNIILAKAPLTREVVLDYLMTECANIAEQSNFKAILVYKIFHKLLQDKNFIHSGQPYLKFLNMIPDSYVNIWSCINNITDNTIFVECIHNLFLNKSLDGRHIASDRIFLQLQLYRKELLARLESVSDTDDEDFPELIDVVKNFNRKLCC